MNEKELNEDFEEVLWEAKLFEEETDDRIEMNNRAVHKELADKYIEPKLMESL